MANRSVVIIFIIFVLGFIGVVGTFIVIKVSDKLLDDGRGCDEVKIVTEFNREVRENITMHIPYNDQREKHGLAVAYYDNGQIFWQKTYEHDKIMGIVKKYRKDGSLLEEIPYENGLINGVSKRYDEEGRISLETPYVNGEIHGIQKWYSYSHGSEEPSIVESEYENGERVH